jgi:hypothetical protein
VTHCTAACRRSTEAITQRLITSWLGATVGLKAAAGKDPMSPRRLEQHREALIDAVGRIAEPR